MRAVAEGGGETDYGSSYFFNTVQPGDPSVAVETHEETDLEWDSATLNGELTELEYLSDADVFFEWRETGASDWNSTSKQNLSSIGTFDENITGLEEETQYEFKAIADAEEETDTGEVKYFTTSEEPEPSIAVETHSASNVDHESAQLNGELTELVNVSDADVYFEYKKSSASDWTSTSKQNMSSTGTFDEHITGLDDDTQYDFKAIAEGEGEYEEGTVENFTTSKAPEVTVVTDPATDITPSSAQLEGELTQLDHANDADVYFEWRETGASSWNSTDKQNKSSTGTFNEEVSGLDNDTEYEFRAVADADGVVDRGDENNFTTLDGAGDPTIEESDVDVYHVPDNGPHGSHEVDFSENGQYCHPDEDIGGEIDEITVELRESDNSVIDTETENVNADCYSGTIDDLSYHGNHDDPDNVKITVTDTDADEDTVVISDID